MAQTSSVPMDAIRQRLESREDRWLAPLATRSAGTHRAMPEESSSVRTEFQRDRDRILHTKSFRRLMHKTQVFIAPRGDHFRTRLTHTLEVTQIARTIGRALDLNEDLIEAIGLGHDLGHPPFGHAGEVALAEVFPGFRHNEQSLRVVEKLEKDGRGLNLTAPVLDGILRHSKPKATMTGNMAGEPRTLEGKVVKIADSIAYINHDLDDALRGGMLVEIDVPPALLDALGHTHAKRIDTLVTDIIANSQVTEAPGVIALSPQIGRAANDLRAFLYERVYEPLNQTPETHQAQEAVKRLFDHFVTSPERMASEVPAARPEDTPERRAADIVASMTDRYALNLVASIADEAQFRDVIAMTALVGD